MLTKSDRLDSGALRRVRKHCRLGAVLGALYVWSYFATILVTTPLQQMVVPETAMSLLFLPHGVRVLAAWLYGWRSVFYLLPGAALCHMHFAGSQGVDAGQLAGLMASLASGPLAFALVAMLFQGITTTVGRTPALRIVLVGALASVMNLSGLTLAYGLVPSDMAVILIGDMGGLVVALVILRGAIWAIER